jgi:hypothetical protein
MLKQEMQDEIEALRAQVAQLEAEREAKANQQSEAGGGQATETKSATQASDAAEPAGGEAEHTVSEETDLTRMFQELVETVDSELKEANPLTVLVVFALGVIVGRLLPR